MLILMSNLGEKYITNAFFGFMHKSFLVDSIRL